MVVFIPETEDRWPLVGRESELALIGSVLREPAAAGLVLVGEAGVGKTRLAREAMARIAAGGRPTCWAVATRSAAAVPFGALAHLLPALDTPVPGLVFGVDDVHLLDSAAAAGLAADGLSSPAIATRPGLSRRTVDNYLGRAYAKLGVSGRRDLADLLGG